MPPFVPRPDALLCFNIYATSHAFTRAYKALLDPLGLTYPQFLVMLSLGQADGVTVGQLSDDVQLDSNTLSPLLKRLESAGLLRRERSEKDERKVLVHLTETGAGIAAQALRIPECMGTVLGLTEADLADSLTLMRRLRSALETTAGPDGGKAEA